MNAGSIVQQNDGEQNIFKQKISKKSVMFLNVTMWVGTLSLMGVPPFGGFFSKESIFVNGLFNSDFGIFALGVTFMTAIYSSRLMFVLFNHGYDLSEKRYSLKKQFSYPMAVLAVLSLLSSAMVFYFKNTIIDEGLLKITDKEFLKNINVIWAAVISVAIVIWGVILSYICFVEKNTKMRWISSKLKIFSKIFENNLYFDTIYSYLIVKPLLLIAKQTLKFENFYTEVALDRSTQDLLNLINLSRKRKQEFVASNVGIFVIVLILLLGIYLALTFIGAKAG